MPLTAAKKIGKLTDMSSSTLFKIAAQCNKVRAAQTALDTEQRTLDRLMLRARRQGHSLREIARATDELLSNVSVHNRTTRLAGLTAHAEAPERNAA